MALNKEDRAEVDGLIKPLADGLAKVTETIAALPTADKMSETVKAQVEAATKPLSDAIAKIGTPPPKPGDKKDPANDEQPAWAKDLAASVKTLADSVAPVLTDRQKNQQADAAKALITKTLTEKKLGGLLKNTAVMDRLIGANPKDEAGVLAAVESERKFAVSLGIKAETFGADVAAEGGKTGDDTTPEAKKQAQLDHIKAEGKKFSS